MGRALRWVRLLDSGLRRLRRRLLPAELVVFEDVTAPWLASALGTACEMGLVEHVPPRQWIALQDLETLTDLSAPQLKRLLRMLASHGYFELDAHETSVRQTRLSAGLLKGRAGNFCHLQASSWYRDCFAADQVVRAMRGSKTPFDHLTGEPFFDHVQEEPAAGNLFSEAMAEITRFCAPYVAESLSLRSGEKVLDVGGGNGEFCRLLQPRFPDVQFAALDLEEHLDTPEFSHLRGDFFQAVPTGFDHLLLKNILHDWEDDQAVTILNNCRAAVEQGRLSLVELVLPNDSGSGASGSDFSVDWNVYCTLGGRERTLQEYRVLLARAGWELQRVSPTATPLWVLEAETSP
jgi:hypothetical protein